MVKIPSIPIVSTKQFQDTRRALGFMYNVKPAGYMTCLKSFVDKKLVEDFRVAGFLKTGYSRKGQTYSITNLGAQYYKDIS